MTGRLLTELSGRVSQADLVTTTDDTLSVTRHPDGGSLVQEDVSAHLQIRVADAGRVGWAGGAAANVDAVVEAAMRSLACSDPAPLWLPAPSPTPEVMTAARDVAGLDPRALVEMLEPVAARVSSVGGAAEVWAERSVGEVQVANTRGVAARYPVSLVGLGASIRLRDSTPEPLQLDMVQAGSLTESDTKALADEFSDLLDPPLLPFQALDQSCPVWFGPRAVRSLLAPVLTKHLGDAWSGASDQTLGYDERITLDDDPHAPLRPGSRPIDDDGVVTRLLRLVDRGRPVAGVLDARLGSRTVRPATGHSYRRGYTAPRVGYSNVVMAAGEADRAALAAATGDGVYVPLVRFGPAPNPVAGVFRVAAPWAYRLDQGDVVGRLDGCWLSGNVFELLRRVRAVGNDARWIGAVRVPSCVVDGVRVRTR